MLSTHTPGGSEKPYTVGFKLNPEYALSLLSCPLFGRNNSRSMKSVISPDQSIHLAISPMFSANSQSFFLLFEKSYAPNKGKCSRQYKVMTNTNNIPSQVLILILLALLHSFVWVWISAHLQQSKQVKLKRDNRTWLQIKFCWVTAFSMST